MNHLILIKEIRLKYIKQTKKQLYLSMFTNSPQLKSLQKLLSEWYFTSKKRVISGILQSFTSITVWKDLVTSELWPVCGLTWGCSCVWGSLLVRCPRRCEPSSNQGDSARSPRLAVASQVSAVGGASRKTGGALGHIEETSSSRPLLRPPGTSCAQTKPNSTPSSNPHAG